MTDNSFCFLDVSGRFWTILVEFSYPDTEYFMSHDNYRIAPFHNFAASLATSNEVTRRKTERMTVDCRGASHGLFFGIVVLVGTIICLIGFFVLVHK